MRENNGIDKEVKEMSLIAVLVIVFCALAAFTSYSCEEQSRRNDFKKIEACEGKLDCIQIRIP